MAYGRIKEPANTRSRRTRTALFAAARAILEAQGFEALTMSAVADRAGVTRCAVYLHFATRADLIAGLFDHVAVVEGLDESLRRVWSAPDAVSALDEWAAHLARYHPRILAVDRAVERVRSVDVEASAHRKRVVRAKLANCRRLVQRLHEEDCLTAPWSPEHACDMLFSLISSDMIEALIVDRRWSRRRLTEHLSLLFRSTFAACSHQDVQPTVPRASPRITAGG